MTVIEASSGTYRSRVDGTIVLSVEIEPRYRAEALALFGMPGTAMALAALKPATSKPEKAERERLGPLCQWAVMRCKEPEFQQWLGLAMLDSPAVHEQDAANAIYQICRIESRKELDTNEKAAAIFKDKIISKYSAWWLKKQGETA